MSILSSWLFRFTFTLFFLLGACSSIDKHQGPPEVSLFPPDAAHWPINRTLFAHKDFESIDLFLNRVVTENPSQHTAWWTDYRRAQLWTKRNTDVACENYVRLALEPQFPLNRLAFLRAHEVCPYDNQITRRLPDFETANFDPWLEARALDVAIQKARDHKRYSDLSDLLIKKSKLNLPLESKIDLTKEALKVAREHLPQPEVRRITQRLYRLSPSEDPRPHRRDSMAVAQDFRRRRLFSQAEKFYEKIISDKRRRPSEVVQAYMGLRNSYRIQQNRAMALQTTKKLADYAQKFAAGKKASKSDHELYVKKALLLARNYWTDEKKSLALATLDRAEKMSKGKTSFADVYWIRGRMAEEDQDHKRAIAYYDLAMGESQVPNHLKERLLWYKAWSLRKLEQHKEAAAILAELKDLTESDYDRLRYQFWLAKSYQALDKKSAAKSELKDLIELEPGSYYGYLAHRELDLALPQRPDEDEHFVATPPRPLRALMDKAYLDWLIAVREDKVAEEYLDHVAEVLKRREPLHKNQEAWEYVLQMYAKSNNFQRLFVQLHSLPSEMRRSIVQNRPHLQYPQPFQEFVAASANRFGIGVDFIYSIMRQESAFDPQARSHMDAFGLMQLLPQVAEVSAKENGIPMNATEDLYEPHINIPLGSAHLRKLWDRYGGDLVLAVASYNASEKAILNWLKTRYKGDSLEFIEDIPYDETREYVKLVLRNLITYQVLTSNKQEANFPEWALRIERTPATVSN